MLNELSVAEGKRVIQISTEPCNCTSFEVNFVTSGCIIHVTQEIEDGGWIGPRLGAVRTRHNPASIQIEIYTWRP